MSCNELREDLNKNFQKQEYTEIEKQETLSYTLNVSDSIEENWLPEIERNDGSLVESLEDFRDYELAMGNCSDVASCAPQFTDGELSVIEERIDGPFLTIHAANFYQNENGKEWVIDYTHSQFEPNAKWSWVGSKK